jgi:4-hydroxymandelate oxidase
VTLLNVADYEAAAQEKLAANALDYYRSGAHDEITLAHNRSAWDRIELHYRVLVDVSKRSMETTVLGHALSMPIALAPTAFHGLACADAELATARAASRAKTLMCLSSLSNTNVEEVVPAAAPSPVFFQLYVYKDRAVTRELLLRAATAGCKAIVVTVDAPRLGRRERDARNRFHLPKGLHVRNLVPAGFGELPITEDSGLAAYFEDLIDPALAWKDIAWLRSISPLPIVIKGIVRADDAAHAAAEGAAAIVVSNHGGRQLDGSPATADVLARCVDAIGGRAEVLVDGGIRRGTDVLKAISLGARCALVGRPILWGLAVNGADGATAVLDILRRELDLAMTLAGAPTLADLSRDLLLL